MGGEGHRSVIRQGLSAESTSLGVLHREHSIYWPESSIAVIQFCCPGKYGPPPPTPLDEPELHLSLQKLFLGPQKSSSEYTPRILEQ
jgi:hypothetical protein